MLHGLTVAINFIGMMLALWLGLYLVTRSSRSMETWFVALAMWSVGGFFLNQLLALYPPAPPPEIRAWLYHLMVFWPHDVFEMGWKGWLFGWLPAYSMTFWFHATLSMLPGPFTRRSWWLALLGYAVTLVSILVKARYMNTWINLLKDPLNNSFMVWPYSPWFAVGLIVFAVLSVYNLAHSTRSSTNSISRAQFWLFVSAIGMVVISGLLGMIFSFLTISIPQVFIALFWLAALILAGKGIFSRYGRIDFLSNSNQKRRKLRFRLQDHISQEGSQDSNKKLINNVIQEKRQDNDPIEHFLDLSSPHETEPSPRESKISFRSVELALRNLYNYAYLADSPLSQLCLITQRINGRQTGGNTYLDRGREVSTVLSEVVSSLRPSREDVPNPPPRNWYPYLVLWEAYVENKPNREIMQRLFISEGTFNRTRKAAISTVARLLLEMEEHLG